MSRSIVVQAIVLGATLALAPAIRPAGAQGAATGAPVVKVPAGKGTATMAAAARALSPRRTATLVPPPRLRPFDPSAVQIELRNLGAETYRVRIGSAQGPCRFAHAVLNARTMTPVNGALTLADTLYLDDGNAGRTCPVMVYISRYSMTEYVPVDTLLAGSITIDAVERYTVAETWAIKPFVSSILGQHVTAGATGACEGLSVGTAGIIPIGVVEHEKDISLHIRSGLAFTECAYDSSPGATQLNPGWAILDQTWAVTRARGDDDKCSINNYSSGAPSYTYSRAFHVHAQMRCEGGPDNDNGVRLTLKSIIVAGPPHMGSALPAFIR